MPLDRHCATFPATRGRRYNHAMTRHTKASIPQSRWHDYGLLALGTTVFVGALLHRNLVVISDQALRLEVFTGRTPPNWLSGVIGLWRTVVDSPAYHYLLGATFAAASFTIVCSFVRIHVPELTRGVNQAPPTFRDQRSWAMRFAIAGIVAGWVMGVCMIGVLDPSGVAWLAMAAGLGNGALGAALAARLNRRSLPPRI